MVDQKNPQKPHAIAVEFSKYEVEEIEEIATYRNKSCLSTCKRNMRLLDLEDAKDMEKWKRQAMVYAQECRKTRRRASTKNRTRNSKKNW